MLDKLKTWWKYKSPLIRRSTHQRLIQGRIDAYKRLEMKSEPEKVRLAELIADYIDLQAHPPSKDNRHNFEIIVPINPHMLLPVRQGDIRQIGYLSTYIARAVEAELNQISFQGLLDRTLRRRITGDQNHD